jgi:thiol-disulfide isomerase/thioredoxin
MLRSGAPLPSFDGATAWINGAPAPDDLRGHPVFVQIWALSCHLCKENQPILRALRDRFRPRGVAFVSIHMPRQASDTSLPAVTASVIAQGMDEPVAVDGTHAIGDRFDTGGVWPAYFLFDADGKLRARAAGEAGLGVMINALERMAPAPAA